MNPSRWLKTRTAQLTGSYLLVIMTLSLAFSLAIYKLSVDELGRQVPPDRLFRLRPGGGDVYDYFFNQRISEARGLLIARLVLLNLFVLAVGAVLSRYLARRTLRPIERAMNAQSRFVTDASHELKTPLTALMTTNEVALRNKKLTLKEAKDRLHSNLEDISALRDLAEGLLSLAQPRLGPVSLQPVAVQDIAAEAVNRLLPAAQAKEITLEDKLPNLSVVAEPNLLTQALVILIDNAVKYSPEGSLITLEGSTHGSHGKITVGDEGPGISAADLPHVFDRFYRADKSRTSGGHGLGLSIARQIVEHLGGYIEASSQEKRGSLFSIVLPLAKPLSDSQKN